MLRPITGRCVVLLQSHQQFMTCLDSRYFHGMKIRGVNIGGCVCCIVTADRTDVSFASSLNENKNDDVVMEKKKNTDEMRVVIADVITHTTRPKTQSDDTDNGDSGDRGGGGGGELDDVKMDEVSTVTATGQLHEISTVTATGQLHELLSVIGSKRNIHAD